MPQDSLSSVDDKGLDVLEARLREDLDYLCYPGKDWVPPRDGVTDVVIIGGGMCGMVAWLALWTGGVSRIRVLDRSAEGREGPWLTYARMETLRSPKTLTGPAFGHGALTFQAWHRAQFGASAWDALDKIPRPMWMDYLRWYRKAFWTCPVENGVSVDRVEPEGDLLRLHRQRGGRESDPDAQAGLRHRPRRHWRAEHTRLRRRLAAALLGAQRRRDRLCG
jgi:hypothetical protein